MWLIKETWKICSVGEAPGTSLGTPVLCYVLCRGWYLSWGKFLFKKNKGVFTVTPGKSTSAFALVRTKYNVDFFLVLFGAVRFHTALCASEPEIVIKTTCVLSRCRPIYRSADICKKKWYRHWPISVFSSAYLKSGTSAGSPVLLVRW